MMKSLLKVADSIGAVLMYLAVIMALSSMISESYVSAIIAPIVLYTILKSNLLQSTICKKLGTLLLNKQKRIIIIIMLWLISVLVMVLITWNMRVELTWDWGRLLSTAAKFVKTGEWERLEYFAQCTNNIPWEAFLIVYFRVIHFFYPAASYDFYYTASVCMSISFVALSMLLTYESARHIFSDEIKAFICLLVILTYSPFYLYAQFAYTDTISLLLVNVAVYSYLLFKKNGNAIVIIICAISGGLIFFIKIIGFIVIIAILIDYIVNYKHIPKRKMIRQLLVEALI